ncbi:uncharacterized protein LOC135817430 [Sycon ciliatum]|uniref:uncharacterized protein LOC135817430 n=1 Tax=Sycon ciliatum TaxID=27933 RepID=UPI0031F60861
MHGRTDTLFMKLHVLPLLLVVVANTIHGAVNEKQAVAGPVANLAAFARSDSEVDVKWQPPLVTNGVLQYYQLDYGVVQLQFQVTQVNISSQSTHHRITGLPFGNRVVVIMRAVTSAGPGHATATHVTTRPLKYCTLSPRFIRLALSISLVNASGDEMDFPRRVPAHTSVRFTCNSEVHNPADALARTEYHVTMCQLGGSWSPEYTACAESHDTDYKHTAYITMGSASITLSILSALVLVGLCWKTNKINEYRIERRHPQKARLPS